MDQDAGLIAIDGFDFEVRASVGAEATARRLARRVASARSFFTELFDGVQPGGGLRVISSTDWVAQAAYPVYGMPHFARGDIIVASEAGDFWRRFGPMLLTGAPAHRPALQAAYGNEKAGLDLTAFFDLLSVHELAHLYHDAVPFRFPTHWLTELFANLALHAYVAEREPESLPTLQAFPAAMVSLDSAQIRYRSLADFERLYVNVGPDNYGWYQVHLHVGARRIYEAGGLDAVRRLWAEFSGTPARLSSRLARQVHPAAAELLSAWPR